MTHSDLYTDLITAQTRLISALDARSPDDILAASAGLADIIAELNEQQSGHVGEQTTAKIAHAIKQSDAAKMRVNILSEWNRKRIDRLGELRGGKPCLAYDRRSHG